MRDWDWDDVKCEALVFFLAIILPIAIIVMIAMALREPSKNDYSTYPAGDGATKMWQDYEEHLEEQGREQEAERKEACAYYGWCD